MAEPFLGELRLFSFQYAPRGWAACNGQLLPISQNQALYSLLGTTYGGDGRVTFALPDLRGRVPAHVAATLALGTRFGAEAHTLGLDELPGHTHSMQGTSSSGTASAPRGSTLAASPTNPYRPHGELTSLRSDSLATVGGSQAHENRQPFLTLMFCIAMQGLFPSQN